MTHSFSIHKIFLFSLFGLMSGVRVRAQHLPADSSSVLIAQENAMRGATHAAESKYFFAADAYERALETAYADSHPDFAKEILSALGSCYEKVGHSDKAIIAVERLSKIYERARDSVGLATCWSRLGHLYLLQGEYERAQVILGKGMDAFFSREGYMRQKGEILNNLGQTHLTGPEPDFKAVKRYALGAFDAFEIAKDSAGMILALLNASRANISLGILEESEKLTARASRLIEQQGGGGTSNATLFQVRGELAFARRQFLEAETWLGLAREMFKENQDIEKLIEVWRIFMQMYAAKSDLSGYEWAVSNYQQDLLDVRKEISLKISDELRELYDTRAKEDEIRRVQDVSRSLGESISSEAQKSRLKSAFIVSIILVLLGILAFFLYARAKKANRRLRFSLYQSYQELARQPTESSSTRKALLEAQGQESHEPPEGPGKDIYKRVCDLMEREKLYLQPDLVLESVAAKLTTNKTYVSHAINAYSNGNFKYFINEYRIREAMRIIEKAGNQDSLSFKDVARSSGFKSYSTFFRVFKQFAGMNPGEYIEKYNS